MAVEKQPKQRTHMNDFQKPIDRKNHPSIEQPQAIPPIEKDKQEKDEELGEKWKETTGRPFVFATMFSYLKKLISSFTGKGKSVFMFDQQKFIDDLLSFRNLLILLCNEDHSHDPHFLEQMSELWHILMHDCNPIDPVERKNLAIPDKLNIFINTIASFPPGEDHSLGYYLSEHAGSEWIPFPFMNLLQKLHEEHQIQAEQSILSSWLILLNSILEEMNVKID
jgi:hypothetical protein